MDQRGIALLEFAVLLLPLCIVCLGTVDFARAYQLQIKLRNAAREGVAFGQYYPDNATTACAGTGSSQTILERATLADSSVTIPAANVTITDKNGNTVTCASTFSPGDTITVKVTGTFTPLTPFVSSLAGASALTVSATQTAIVQR